MKRDQGLPRANSSFETHVSTSYIEVRSAIVGVGHEVSAGSNLELVPSLLVWTSIRALLNIVFARSVRCKASCGGFLMLLLDAAMSCRWQPRRYDGLRARTISGQEIRKRSPRKSKPRTLFLIRS